MLNGSDSDNARSIVGHDIHAEPKAG